MAADKLAALTIEEALGSARETRALLVGEGALNETARIFREQFPGAQAVIIADERTFRAAGQRVAQMLALAGVTCRPPFIFSDPDLYAEMRFVDLLEAALRLHDSIPIAVGSGTINDLTKLASHRAGRPAYMCVASAASMDGYTAFGASITYEGAKQTFNCPAPRAVIADLEVIRNAPPELVASGYADLAAKITAGADWIIADALGIEPIDARAWQIVQAGLLDSLADPSGAREGKPGSIGPLVEGLMLGGFAMQWSKSSRPASGAEHQFSHLWDMEHHVHEGQAPSHGFKVGIATLAVTEFYEELLRADLSVLDVDACVKAWPDWPEVEADLRRRFKGTDFLETALAETQAKQTSKAELRDQLQSLRVCWPGLASRLSAQLLPSGELRSRLDQVGAPTAPEQIGISRQRLRDSFRRAYHIRRRFTVLDLAIRAGLLDSILQRQFASVPDSPSP